MNRFQSLTSREKRLVRFAAIGIGIYLVAYAGFRLWRAVDQNRADYQQLAGEARQLREQTKPYQDKVVLVKKLMDDARLDPARLKRESVVAEASAAIQKAAKAGGLQLGPIRESPGRGSGLTLAAVQLESSGPVPAALSFLGGLNTIGFPLIVDSVQFTADNSQPGRVKMSLIILILDFNQQKEAKEAPHA
jgi:hypothetical protein